LKLLIEKDIDTIKEEVEIIKQSFYKRTKAEAEESKHLFLEAGGEESEFKVDKDELEDTLKSLLNEYRSKKQYLRLKSKRTKKII